MKIAITSVKGVTAKETKIHWNIIHTVDIESGETKAYFLTDDQFLKLGFKSDLLTNLKTGEIRHLTPVYDNRGTITGLDAE